MPPVDFTPDQPSPEPPPVALQLVAFVELHVIDVVWSAAIVVGIAESVTSTGGHDQSTETTADVSETPVALQLREYETVPGADSVNVRVPLEGTLPLHGEVGEPLCA